jgi:DNA polymerase III subunit gamma/tau
VESPLALYRRYRPETFAEVIGQDHVTEPLRVALANDRVNHAYLFSGPRGCGKTTSARILARALNCVKAPVADPCGECDSCRELARGGHGSMDVIEIDAASHGGVDDARDLREKAYFAPVRDRFKIYIIDEAHMVSSQGFNALLKLVEEPPPHLRFIFATTAPEKVLSTIRSRTHHYPFRLIPPRLMSDYLAQLAEQEGVSIEPAALPLVVRAGGGSARDTLSVLDQLLGGAGPEGVTHGLATGLLGFTPDTLLDEVVDAFAARDGAAVFGVVDKVIETGQDPRGFTDDLLRRLRDLVIVAAVPDAPASGLIDVPEDQGERLVAQAARFGAIELSRAADIVAAGLTEMRGATAPRLLLELICARVLLPGADHTSEGVMARLERLERRMAVPGQAPAPPAPASAGPAAGSVSPPAQPARPAPASPPGPAQRAAPDQPTSTASPAPSAASAPVSPPGEPGRDVAPPPPELQDPPAVMPPPRTDREPQGKWQVQAPGQAPAQQPPAEQQRQQPQPSAGGTGGGLSLVDVRRLWPDILEATKSRRRLAWMLLTQNAQVLSVDGSTLTLGFANAGARDSFTGAGCDEILRQTAIDVVGVDWRIEVVVDPGAGGGGGRPAAPPTAAATAPEAEAPRAEDSPSEAAEPAPPAPAAPEGPPAWAAADPPRGTAPGAAPSAAEPVPDQPRPADPQAVAAAREAISPTRRAGAARDDADDGALADAEAHPDDPDADTHGLDSTALLEQALGARLIEEIKHD